MKHSTIVTLARVSIILLAVLGLCVSCLYIPGLLDGSLSDSLASLRYAEGPDTFGISRVIFLELCVLPCYAILAIGWMLTVAIERDTVFTKKTASLFRIAAFLLCGDAIFYFIGNVVFFIISGYWKAGQLMGTLLTFYLIRLVFIVIVLICALVCAVLCQYLNKAAELKEDNDSIL